MANLYLEMTVSEIVNALIKNHDTVHITFGLNHNSEEKTTYYHLVFCAKETPMIVFGTHSNDISEKHHYRILSKHQSCWRHDSFRDLKKIIQDNTMYGIIDIKSNNCQTEIIPIDWNKEYIIDKNKKTIDFEPVPVNIKNH
jgi:hydroxymethylpyrimidine pyrophosphatase-like HAD family hydrolase